MNEDNPTPAEMQAYEERAMFELFVEYSGLSVIPSSIQSRPVPEPDILCQLENMEWVAFELGELNDEKFRRGHGTMLQFRELLWRIFGELPEDTRKAIEDQYGSCRIDVTFNQQVNLRRHKAAIASFYQWFATQKRFIGILTAGELPPNVASAIPNVRVSEPSPGLWIEPGFSMSVTEPTLDVFHKKVGTEYKTAHPMELLLHSFLPLSNEWLKRYAETLGQGIANSPFRRVWVFSPSQRTTDVHPVRLVYPPYE